MLRYVHQLVANFLCRPCGAEQVASSVLSELWDWKQLPSVCQNLGWKEQSCRPENNEPKDINKAP